MRARKTLHIAAFTMMLVVALFHFAGCREGHEAAGPPPAVTETANYEWQRVQGPPDSIGCMSAHGCSRLIASVTEQEVYQSIYYSDGASWEKGEEITVDEMVLVDGDSTWGVGWENGPVVWHFDGSTWNARNDLGMAIDHLVKITGTGDDNIWITCVDATYKGAILHFDGSRWRKQLTVDGWLSFIDAADEKHVWALGRDEGGEEILYFYDGNRWHSLGNVEGMYGVTGIAAVDAKHVWISAVDGVYFFNGEAWARQFQERTVEVAGLSDEESMVAMHDIYAVDSSHVWCVGSYYVPARNEPGLEVKLRHGVFFFNGEHWVRQYECEENILGVFAHDEDNVWAYGQGVLLYGKKTD
ncbi:MAG: hypothetical protein HPY75_15110 [Actinobacteria bacterium]|nr:hypothetical protein [Actinomycetota bacterium]